MKLPKKSLKAKEPVRLRCKELRHGNKSLYLDYYDSGRRRYEFLKLYLVPELTHQARQQNKETLKAATSIKSRRIIELNNGKAGIKTIPQDISLNNLINKYKDERKGKCAPKTIDKIRHFSNAMAGFDTDLSVSNIDENYCIQLIRYLRQKPNAKCIHESGRIISECTVRNYLNVFCSIMNFAVRKGFIPANPMAKVDSHDKPGREASKRCFLTIEELKRLIETPTSHKQTRDAFLFSCFCGLRQSDIRNLKWGNLEQNNGKCYANIIVQKTGTGLYLPIGRQARDFLPPRPSGAGDDEHIFSLPSTNSLGRHLASWAKDANISKHLTFHVARHTFATTSLTLGADLYTTSKLLGHSNITTTQIYARIINEKKDEAVALFNKVF